MTQQGVVDYFDINDAPDAPPTIPPGEYHLKVVDAEVRDTKEGGGKFINYRAVVQAGEFAGRSIFAFWTLRNASGKQDNTWRTKRDWKLLGFSPVPGSFEEVAAGTVGLEGYAAVSLKDRSNGEGKENSIKSFLRAL